MAQYRKKPIVIEAYQADKELIIHTLEGDMKANIGDYIITGIKGEQYPCKPEIFEQTYEVVTNNADVVPKSEVDLYKKQVDELEDELASTYDKLENAKAEVEELQAKVARLRKENVELLISKETDLHISMEKLVKARTEHPIFKAIEEKVAREIFEELEEVLRQHTEGGYYLNGTWFPERLDLYTGDAIAELKKKYMEE